jgi:hypothetical protein
LCIFVFDSNEITPSKFLRNNIKEKEKFCVVLVHSISLITKVHIFTPPLQNLVSL